MISKSEGNLGNFASNDGEMLVLLISARIHLWLYGGTGGMSSFQKGGVCAFIEVSKLELGCLEGWRIKGTFAFRHKNMVK